MQGVFSNKGEKEGHPVWKAVILALLACPAWQWLQIGTDMVLIITSTGDELLRGINIDDLEWPWTPKIWKFSEFIAISECDTHFKSELCRNGWGGVDQDTLHIKFSALNVDFSSLYKSQSLTFNEACTRGCLRGVPPKKWLFFQYWLDSVKMVADRHRHAALVTCFLVVLTSMTLNPKSVHLVIFCDLRLQKSELQLNGWI